MSRYINIEPYEKDGWYLQKRYRNSYGEVIKTTPLNCVPTAEPTKHGRWVPNKDGHGCDCSECGTTYSWREADTMRYCKRCGARIENEE